MILLLEQLENQLIKMIREIKNQKVFLTIISSNRSKNVSKMTKHFGPATWVIPKNQVNDYKKAGAESIIISDNNLSSSRNKALEKSFKHNLISVQTDDDLSKIAKDVDGKAVDMNSFEALEDLIQRLAISDYCLAGVSPTANPYFISKKNSTNLLITNSLIAVKPSSPRFDLNLSLKEDYDFTIKHIIEYGGVQRCDDLLPYYLHNTNKGGRKDFRTEEREEQECQYLLNKYPDLIKEHPRRDKEVILNVKKNFRMQLI